MTTITGIPAHALLVHAMVVLAPLTAMLEMLCAVWPAARRRLVWLVLAFAAVTLVLTPLTTTAGDWLFNQQPQPSDILITHANRGQWMILFSGALLIVALALAVLHWLESRSDKPRKRPPRPSPFWRSWSVSRRSSAWSGSATQARRPSGVDKADAM